MRTPCEFWGGDGALRRSRDGAGCSGRTGAPPPRARAAARAGLDRARPHRDPARASAGHQRADREAQLIEHFGRGQFAEQLRPAFGKDSPVTAVGQRLHGEAQVGGVFPGHDDVGVPAGLGAQLGGRLLGGDEDGPCSRLRGGQQRAGQVEADPPGDHRDGRHRSLAVAQARRQFLRADGGIPLGPDRARTHENHVAEGAEQGEQVAVGLAGQPGTAPRIVAAPSALVTMFARTQGRPVSG